MMANLEKLDDSKFTIAMLPEIVKEYGLLNYIVKVTNNSNGKIVYAMVTDTGGFGKYGRIADLSKATKEFIGCGDLCYITIEL